MQSGETKEEELSAKSPETVLPDSARSGNNEVEKDLGMGSLTVNEEEGDESERDLSHSMTVVEHLDELRWRIIRSLVYVALAFVASLFFTKRIMIFLEKPAGNITFQALSIEEPLIVFFKVAFYVALIIASPFILVEAARFISPGLTRRERRIVAPVVIGSPVLFVTGAAFAYSFLLPPMLHFFSSFGQGVSPINQRLDFYISLVSSIMFYMGLAFQIPIVIFALAMADLVTSTQLLKIWRYAVFGATLLAAIITPDPTAFSMLLVMAALCGLYFISVILLKIFGK